MTIAASNPPADPLHSFRWEPQPRARALVAELTDDFLNRCPEAARVRDRMLREASVRFIDMIDSIAVPALQTGIREKLLAAGFTEEPVVGAPDRFVHRAGLFPAVILQPEFTTRLDLKVESVIDFLAAWQIHIDEPVQGEPLAPLRRARVAAGSRAELWVAERHGYRGFGTPIWGPSAALAVVNQQEILRRRTREFGSDAVAFEYTLWCIEGAVQALGPDRAADVFFRCEREYWQRRNRAARIQKMRQDQLGLGWANHDHHTYRSSRERFVALVFCLEKLGFVCRERFYAGAEAGWGAQILEQPNAGIIIFADVDLSADELTRDFAHQGLDPRQQLGTVGLWCALHGEAFLQAGMHHLECQFDFSALTRDIASAGIKVMNPFTDFPYLKQAFTEGEFWPLREDRLGRLLADRRITEEQAARFRAHGALGSHLENLQRDDGFKGFNQTGVSDIIRRTDPRGSHGA